jgi:sucrose-6-phosphate hydrolase SacC (GH32 family)
MKFYFNYLSAALLLIMMALPTRGQTRMMFSDSDYNGTSYAKNPFVIRFGGSYWLYYSTTATDDGKIGWGIGIAKSQDLNHWTKVGEMLPSANYSIEKKGISAACAVVRNDTIHLFYQTYGNGADDAICHAYSIDAIHFNRDITNPVFKPQPTWNCGRAIDAEVHLFKGKYYLYYASRDKAYRKQIIGVATTSKHSSFSKGSFVEACDSAIMQPVLDWEGDCIEAPSIIRRNNKLYMFYAGNYNNAPQQIGVAESQDGIHWKRCMTVPFLKNGEKGTWNSSESGHPGIFDDGKKSYLFFEGNNDKGKTWYISNVEVKWTSKGPYLKTKLK